jgi:DNA modification methylase
VPPVLNHRRIQFGNDSKPPNRLVCGDSALVARSEPEQSLDLVYIDPPFGTGTVREGRGSRYIDRPDDPEAFTEWLAPVLEESHRLLRPTGSLFVHLDYRSVHYVKVFLDGLFGRARFVNELIWCYSVGGKSRRSFGKKHDTILWYARGSKYAFYPEPVHVPRKPSSHMRVVIDEHGREVQEKTDRKTGKVYRYPVHRGKIPEDWWTDIETLNRSDRERTGWPTQKPERLLRRIVLATTTEGDRVADWFSGSGTTAAVAQAHGRGFIAVDRAREAVEGAARRLEALGREQAASAGAPPDLLVETRLESASLTARQKQTQQGPP